jgi:aspartokinase-like uncharacterized kinase
MTVVKVGGSLFDHPGLGPGLRAWRAGVDGPVLLVPGGGELADVVRKWDRVHSPGDESSHRMAVLAMSFAGLLFGRGLGCEVFDPEAVLNDSTLPRSWAVTSDSISARVAATEKANRLVLLKSVDVPPGTSWSEAAAKGWVDDYFPTAVAPLKCPIDVINFRRWLSENGFGK